MIMNYVLSFCRITAASRIFSRNFYLPLLKPLTPKDALRTFKITGKWLLGSKIHHYIPVLFNHRKRRSKTAKNYGKIVHKQNHSYTYMSPVLDPENENHKVLMEILKGDANEDFFVYTVEDKMYNIVFPGTYELAIRNGDIIDILVSQSNDKILIKLKNFKKISMELEFYENDRVLYMGEGATSVEEEKFHHHGKMIMSLAKIFEAKELAEEWEMEMMKIVAKKKKQKGEGSAEWNEMVNKSIQNLDWQQFEVEAKKVIDQIWEPAHEEHIGMEVEDLEKTRNVPQFIVKEGLLDQLPTMSEIPDVVKNMASGTYHEYEEVDDDDEVVRRISGVKVTLDSGKVCFITGQMVKTDEGEVFVPGQTIENDFGLSYAPGFTVNMDGSASLIKGLIMGEEDNQKPMFLPTESSITADGELTFCRNPEEKSKAMPQKIFIKRNASNVEGSVETPKKRKKKKGKSAKDAVGKGKEVVDLCANGDANVSTNGKASVEDTNGNEDVCSNGGEVVDVWANGKTDLSTNNEDANGEEAGVQNVRANGDEVCSNGTEANDEDNDTSGVLVEEQLALGIILCIENSDDVTTESVRSEEDSSLDLEYDKKINDDFSKPFDDGMDKLIGNLEDKTSELQKKLEALRKLTVTLENAVTYVNTGDANEVASKITEDVDKMHKLSDVLLTLTRRADTFREKHDIDIRNISNPSVVCKSTFVTEADEKFQACSEKLKVALKSAIFGANEVYKTRPKDQLLALNTLSDILKDVLIEDKVLEELCLLMNTNLDRNEICTSILKELTQAITENKVEILKSAVKLNENDSIIDKISEILDTPEDVLGGAFKKVAKNNENLTRKVVEHAKMKIDIVKTEMGAKEALQASIVVASKEFAEECLLDLEDYADQMEIKEFLSEAAGLASTLGLYEVGENLNNLSVEENASVLTGSKASSEFLKRFMLIRKLCERDYSVKTSLQRIKKHPDCGRTDPRIRQLLKESASLISRNREIKNSLEIPLRLFQEQNFLAIEDCVNQKATITSPIMISRKGIQAVVPKESVRNVLAGRVSYTLVDETGVTNFKPMHMFAALKLGKSHQKRFEDYAILGGRDTKRRQQKEHVYNPRTSPAKTSSDVRKRIRKLSLNNSRMTA